MKKIVICNVPMRNNTQIKKGIYQSDDRSIPVSDWAVKYPVNALLECTTLPTDMIKAILLVKRDSKEYFKKNLEECIAEMTAAVQKCGASIEFHTIYSDFEETKSVHDTLLLDIIDELENNSHVIADITYGPKDLPIVLFTALNFAERFLGCEVDNIVYGQAEFDDAGNAECLRIRDMVPLYYLNFAANTIQCNSAEDSKKVLKTLLSI